MSYSDLLNRIDLAGVYHLPQGSREAILQAAEATGFRIYRVDLKRAQDKAQMLTTIAAAMEFPDWFGNNFDALADCLTDLAGEDVRGYLVLLENCDQLRSHASDDFAVALELFDAAAAEWRELSIPFWCLVDMVADGIAWLPTIA